ncbi:Dyp-type peroxidase domain-containing protein, partial [Vibrio casei]|uniref:Dyp-type peroxidase domain-containing protein n=1 Tax=Vibrio casei TaxID=673372 RepID=UPI003F9B5BCC
MSHPQSAITPEANPFGLYCLFKIHSNHEKVLQHIKALPQLVSELNQQKEGANLVLSVAFTHQFWVKTNQPIPEELAPFVELGVGDFTA